MCQLFQVTYSIFLKQRFFSQNELQLEITWHTWHTSTNFLFFLNLFLFKAGTQAGTHLAHNTLKLAHTGREPCFVLRCPLFFTSVLKAQILSLNRLVAVVYLRSQERLFLRPICRQAP